MPSLNLRKNHLPRQKKKNTRERFIHPIRFWGLALPKATCSTLDIQRWMGLTQSPLSQSYQCGRKGSQKPTNYRLIISLQFWLMLLIEQYRRLRPYNGLRWEVWNQKMFPQGSETEWSLAQRKSKRRVCQAEETVYKDLGAEWNWTGLKVSVSRTESKEEQERWAGGAGVGGDGKRGRPEV